MEDRTHELDCQCGKKLGEDGKVVAANSVDNNNNELTNQRPATSGNSDRQIQSSIVGGVAVQPNSIPWQVSSYAIQRFNVVQRFKNVF